MSEIRKIGVVGAGNMGSGIAQKYATEGYPVMLVDLDNQALERGMSIIRTTLSEGVERKIFKEEQARQIGERITPILEWEQLVDCDLIVEAVFEDLEIKRSVFTRLGEVVRPDCLLGTNTSSFFVKQVSEVTVHPERVLGLHYFYHPAKNRLVEVIPAPETTDENIQRCWRLQERIGKTPIASTDAPGFVVNRFFVPWINEAARIFEEGIADIPTIEQAAVQGFRIGMGPFQLMNVTGIKIGYHAAATLERELGPFYKPSGIIQAFAESGNSFEYEGTPDDSKFTMVRERLLGVTYHVASQLVSEGVGSIEDVDIGARVGLRWAQGPFEMMNRQGIIEAFRVQRAAETFYGLDTPTLVSAQVKDGTPFAIELVKSSTEDGVATITLNRPDAMNALNPEVFEQLDGRLDAAIADGGVRGIVIAGSGKAFIAGADIRFFVKNMKAGQFDRINAFAKQGQDLLRKIESSPKPVIAKLDGLALGGGFELALACDQIIATDKAVLAFPESGIGIYPGLGGTQRTSRRVGQELTKWLVYTGQFVDGATAKKIGLVDDSVSFEELPAALAAAIDAGKRSDGRQGEARPSATEAVQLDPAFSGLVNFFATHPVADIIAGEVDAGGAAVVEKMIGKIRSKAPLALKVCEELIDEGGRSSLEAGLEMELARGEEIFRTKDAMEGLSTMGKKRPKFIGE